MYEHRTHKLLSRDKFLARVGCHLLLAFAFITVGLGMGVLGYHFLGKLLWLDSLLNASMILSGMGPVDAMTTSAGKIFASFYALFSGLAFIAVASILVAPFAHRVLHRLNMDDGEK